MSYDVVDTNTCKQNGKEVSVSNANELLLVSDSKVEANLVKSVLNSPSMTTSYDLHLHGTHLQTHSEIFTCFVFQELMSAKRRRAGFTSGSIVKSSYLHLFSPT